MATTYIKPYKTGPGMTALDTMKERFDYGLDPEKCAVTSSHLCDPETAHLEFMLTKCEYQAETGRRADAGHLFYQIRQAFPHGEVTPEEANRIGYETAMRWTKGKYQFFVCTHTDQEHIHNHIYFCSTAHDRSRKFHNFWGSTFAVRRLSDRVCLEHGLLEYAELERYTAGAVDRFHDLAGQIQTTEAAQAVNRELKAATVDYAKTRPVFDGYKAARYSKKYLAEHEADITLHRSAQATFRRVLNGGRLPKMDALRAEGKKLAGEKKSLYAQYRAAQKDMREAVAVKGNVDHLLGITEAPKNKEMQR